MIELSEKEKLELKTLLKEKQKQEDFIKSSYTKISNLNLIIDEKDSLIKNLEDENKKNQTLLAQCRLATKNYEKKVII